MLSLITPTLTLFAVISHALLVVFVLAVISRDSWGKSLFNFLGKNAVPLGLLVSLSAVVGSLLYSQILGYEPCSLCWWQRVFVYPTVILFGAALLKKDHNVFHYVIPLISIAAIIALYHSYTQLGGASILPCTAEGGACSKVFVKEYGYVTIPLMSLTVIVYVMFLGWVSRLHKRHTS